MIEKDIESKIIQNFETALSAEGMLSSIQMIGAWQPAEEGDIKALEDKIKDGVVVVKVQPRQYETPTIPDAEMQVNVNLMMRADVDATGSQYLQATSILQDTMHKWQKSFQQYHSDFVVADQFEPTGFRLDGGDCGVDRETCIWSFNQQFSVMGIIMN